MSMNINEIKDFEQKMIDSAFIDAVDYDPKMAARAVGARKMKMKGVCSFNEYISYLQTITGNAKLFWKYQFWGDDIDKLDEIIKIFESERKYYEDLYERAYTSEEENYYGGNVNALEWAIRVINLRRSW